MLSLFLASVVGIQTKAVVPITGSSKLCEGTTTTLSAPSGMRSYYWNTGANTQSITVSTGGLYSVTVVDLSLRSDTGSIEVTVVPNPKPLLNSSIIFLCEGESAKLFPPGYYDEYLWNTGETTNQIIVDSTGDYWLTVTDSNGCQGRSNTVQVIVTPNPLGLLSGPDTSCRNSITIFSVPADPTVVYTWLVDGGSIVSGQGTSAVSVTWTRSGSITVRASKQRPDSSQCMFTQSKFVTVRSRIKPELIYTRSSFCEGQSILLDATPGFSRYRWSTGQTTETIIVTQPGLYWVEAEDTSGCWGISDSLPVVMYPNPDVTIQGPDVVCGSSPVTLTASSIANDVLLWKWSTGETTPMIFNVTSGTYYVIGTTVNGCIDTAWKTVTIGDPIVATVTNLIYGDVATGVPTTAVVQVDNLGTTDISVIEVLTPASITISNVLPEYILVGSSAFFYATIVQPVPGVFSGTIQFVVRSEACYDTLTCIYSGNAVGEPPTDTTYIIVADTVVDAGAFVDLPVTIYQTDTNTVRDADIVFHLTFNPNIYELKNITGARFTEVSSLADARTVEITTRSSPRKRAVLLNGIALLSTPFQTLVTVSSERMSAGPPTYFFHRDGSVAIRGCALPFRTVSFNTVQARVVISTLQGSIIYDGTHKDVTEQSVRSIIESLRAANQALGVVIIDASGIVFYSSIIVP
ncbi:MAG: hypothetical protein HYX66_01505 [Ignavibacteria bacterium]|nr:hypothetical protein [Ignavibacteria bacterium]